ncbi:MULTISPECIES: hypothetical protein [Alphaproteobacteria]|uniref:hypothetical protein n=1 Tax=Alphaproteobacteria TaxID=28211 RepID=UPI0026116EF0|nr:MULTISPECIES: hypothetical protein [Alphaproteobacteria]
MEQLITHVCGHGQVHYLSGFASQQERKARWLRTTKCRTCFLDGKRPEQAEAAVCASAAVAHLDLPSLSGSDRQIAWATTIRATRIAAIVTRTGRADDNRALIPMTEAKWWIDYRDLVDDDLIVKATLGAASTPLDCSTAAGMSQAA